MADWLLEAFLWVLFSVELYLLWVIDCIKQAEFDDKV